ncbi:hypothetical protein B0H13DRAFT_2400904 [Mycena leptocephala]|nr:hypothetical protein B0H13DRAFT_2400904 [Mycena leptocephala]
MGFAPSPRIPQELCEKVLACVTVKYDPEDDIDMQDPYFTLRQCALVCRAWLPSARSHIFRVADLSSSGADRLLVLLNLNPTLTRYMTNVIVRGPTALDPIPLELVAELGPKFTEMKDLTVHTNICANLADSEWSWFWDSDFHSEKVQALQQAILPMLQTPNLARITLRGIPFTANEQIRQFIWIPSLVTLILDNIFLSPKSDWKSDADLDHERLVPTTQHPLAVSSLGLHSHDILLPQWLLHRSCPVNVAALKELSIRLKDVGNMHDFLPLLNAIGSSLKVLGVWLPSRCNFKEYRRFPGIIDAIPALPNAHIEHIVISGFDRRNPSIGVYSRHFDGAEFVKSHLLRLPAPQQLQTVTINEDVEIIWRVVDEFPALQWHNWQAVDEVLAQDSFSNVKFLDFFAGLNFCAFQERKGTVFNLTVDYANLAWRRERDNRDQWDYPSPVGSGYSD